MLKAWYKLVVPWAISNRFQKKYNRTISFVVNVLYPLHCFFLSRFKIKSKADVQVVVSLTSTPSRIKKAYYCISSLIHQTYKPIKLILWLADSQFPKGLDSLPRSVLALQKKGLEIRFCHDYKSYKKFIPTALEFKDYDIVTADDDVLYPEDWLERLVCKKTDGLKQVVCYRAHLIKFSNGTVLPYSDWESLSKDIDGPSRALVPVGVGGILYPKGFFDDDSLDYDVIHSICPTTDDLWLKCVGIKNGYSVVKVDKNSKEWFTIKNTQSEALLKSNVLRNQNDESIKKLLDHFGLTENDFKK